MFELQPQRDPCKELILIVGPYFSPSFQVIIHLDHVDEGIGPFVGSELIDHLIEVALNETENTLLMVESMVVFEGSILADL